MEKLHDFVSSNDIEVQERANSASILIEMLRAQFTNATELNSNQQLNNLQMNTIDFISNDDNENTTTTTTMGSSAVIPSLAIEIVQEMALLFAGELIPVAPKAQKKVPLPDGLDLDEWINPPPEDESSGGSSQDEKDELFVSSVHSDEAAKRRKSEELTPEQMERNRMARIIEQSNNPHYLKSSPTSMDANKQKSAGGSSSNLNYNADQYDNLDDIPISELSLEIPLQIGGKNRIIIL